MKKLLYLILIPLFLISCSNNELTKEEAKKIIAQHFQLPFQTKIAINKKYDDYGWPPEKYRQLVNMGLISIHELRSFITRRYEISLTEKTREYWLQNGILNQAPEGNQSIIVFKGYEIDVKNVSVASNAVEKTAEAEIILEISNISPIQQIFSPLESTEIKKTIKLKLFDSGWKIVEDENSKRLFQPISAPQHWAGGWKITFDNTPIPIGNYELMNESETNEFTLETFKIIPNDVGCMYSTSALQFKKKKYFFLQNSDVTGAYIFINGIIEKLKFINYSNAKGGGEIQNYSNDSYTVSLEVTHSEFDILTVKNKEGKSQTKYIYTECGD